MGVDRANASDPPTSVFFSPLTPIDAKKERRSLFGRSFTFHRRQSRRHTCRERTYFFSSFNWGLDLDISTERRRATMSQNLCSQLVFLRQNDTTM